jgi:large subunit ribosomal protein L17
MRHHRKGRKLSRTADQRKALLAGQVKDLIYHEEIVTTLPKAKETARFAEHLISLAGEPSLHHRRLVLRYIRDRKTVNKLFSVVAPRYDSQKGGYTSIVRIGLRRGDGATMCRLRLV